MLSGQPLVMHKEAYGAYLYCQECFDELHQICRCGGAT